MKHPKYKTARLKAWRNLLVATINAGLQQKLIGLKEDENFWPKSDEREERGITFNFTISDMPAAGHLSDAGWGELNVHGALFPKDRNQFVSSGNAGFLAGDAFAASWLERRKGAWLQRQDGSRPLFWCRRELIERLADVSIEPIGYADYGKFIM